MTDRIGQWARLWRSAWDAETYRQAAASRPASLFGYLALLIGIATILITVQAQVRLTQAARDFREQRWWERHLPEIRITDGEASSPVPQPFMFEQPGFVFVLDTTGATTELDRRYPGGVLLTRHELVVRRPRRTRETRIYSLEQFPNLVLTQVTIEGWLERAQRWGWLAVAVVMTIWLWIAKLTQALLWTLAGLAVNALTGRRLRYGALWNLSILVLTVPLALDLARQTLDWPRLPAWWLLVAVHAGYLVFAVLAQPKPAEPS